MQPILMLKLMVKSRDVYRFLDFQRRVQTDPSYAMDDDDFLREMDAFK
jgi:hypothetical protein